MSETLREKQSRFAQMIGLFIQFASLRGYELTFGDAYRDARVGYGHKGSLHRCRLAVDWNIFKDGTWLKDDANDYLELGEFWESLGGTWGGRFEDPDGPHFSLEHGGMR